jgi:hypothetical protein
VYVENNKILMMRSFMKKLYSIFFGLSVLLVSFIQASEVSTAVLTPMQIAVLYKTYDKYGDDFINHLPASVEQCRQGLITEQRSVQASIDSSSYKNVFVSPYGLLKTGIFMASLVGMWVVGNINMNLLAYEVANDFANTIFNDFAFGGGSFFTKRGRPRLHPNAEADVYSIAIRQGNKAQWADNMPIDVWRKAVAELPEKERNFQIIQNAPLDRFAPLHKYQLGMQALAVGAAISGFGLYKDIQAMRVKKAESIAELKKINNMLVVLKKAR